MTILRIVSLYFFAAIIFTGCSDSSTTTEPIASTPVQELFPLKVGNEWRYDHILFNPGWSIKAHDTVTFTVIDSLVVFNQIYYQIAYNGTPVSYYYQVGATDLYSVPVPGDDNPFHFLHLPIASGKEYTSVDTSFFDGTDSIVSREILNHEFSNLPTTVPAGSFACEQYTLHEFYGPTGKVEPTIDVLYWYSKGVGWVKRETYMWDNGTKDITVTFSLISYRVNK
jgi:hypothetical protein